jgi:hypothetical protein
MHEIAEKQKLGNRLLEREGLHSKRRALKTSITDVQRNLPTAYAHVDPTGEKLQKQLEVDTKFYREELQKAESEMEKLDEDLMDSSAAWPSQVHFGAFGLLLAGFLLQLVAEILKP